MMDGVMSGPRIDVSTSDTQGHLAVDPEALAGLVRRVLEGEGVRAAEVSIALVDDASSHEFNRRHLGHDWPTDVITFPLSEPGDETLVAALVVSAEMAAVTAREVGADPNAELALYVVHGLLHLCGYDDQADEDRALFRRREAEILSREGVPNTFLLAGLADTTDVGRESARWAL
jgi:probable rRNA maturation factor